MAPGAQKAAASGRTQIPSVRVTERRIASEDDVRSQPGAGIVPVNRAAGIGQRAVAAYTRAGNNDALSRGVAIRIERRAARHNGGAARAQGRAAAKLQRAAIRYQHLTGEAVRSAQEK